MDNVLDFIILEQVYKESLKRQWSSGDRFQSLIDDQYWSGTILKRRPFSEDTPNSVWQMYHIKWDDDATDQLSPWDLHPLEIDNGETGTQDYMLHDDATIDYLSLLLPLLFSLPPSLPFPPPSLSLSLSLSASLESFTPLVSCEDLLSAWDREGERERILQGLDAILEKEEDELEEADMFLDPVDLDEEPTYCTVVPFPTSVSTIAERLRNGFYRYKQE